MKKHIEDINDVIDESALPLEVVTWTSKVLSDELVVFPPIYLSYLIEFNGNVQPEELTVRRCMEDSLVEVIYGYSEDIDELTDVLDYYGLSFNGMLISVKGVFSAGDDVKITLFDDGSCYITK